ncbi:MAG: hypothetical protein KJ558_05880 [Gammaproteobacteria bacterium]|nr:hypothetical protein [Gammaproteobacteria bacterium]MBU1654346.1 hypothetical protein [Gammaproteobacteria bacterium]MBU1962664.1 hypothetical protein [Gammaproteobacteria bacterium]
MWRKPQCKTCHRAFSVFHRACAFNPHGATQHRLRSRVQPSSFGNGARDQGTKTLHVLLRGEIEPGDLAKLRVVLPDEAYNINELATLHLDSQGGNYVEALKISEFLLDAAIGTRIDENAECYSACAIVFMAGNYHGGSADLYSIDRVLHIKGKLGFHAPYLKTDQAAPDHATLDAAHMAGVQAINKLIKIMGARHYHGMRAIRFSLLSEMLDRGPNEMLLIDTIDKVGRIEIQLDGHARPKKFTRAMFNRACSNILSWGVDTYSSGFDFTAGGTYDGIQSINETVLAQTIRGYRVVIEYGPGTPKVCHIDITDAPTIFEVNTYTGHFSGSSSNDSNEGLTPYGQMLAPVDYWAFYPPGTSLAELARGD